MNAPTPPPPPPSFLGVGGGGKRAFLDVVRTHGHWCVKKCGVPPPEVISSVESSSSSSSKSSVLSQRKRDDDVPELCAIVDERNRVVDFVDRERTTRERLRGRGSYVLVTTRTPRPPRGQSAVTNNNTEDQDQDQDEEEEEEGDWTTDASVADAYLEFERRLLCLAVPLVEEAQTPQRKGVDEREARTTTTRSTRSRDLSFAPPGRHLSVLSTKRSEKKDVWPGMYDVCTSGVQTAEDFIKWEDDDGQTQFDPYARCAIRELEEELGISGVQLSTCARSPVETRKGLQPIRKFAYSDKFMNIFGQCYKLELDAATAKKIAFLDGEVQEGSGEWLPLRLDDEFPKLMESVVPVGALCCASFLELITKFRTGNYATFTDAEWIQSWTAPKWEDRHIVR